jgi:hypothetical protein
VPEHVRGRCTKRQAHPKLSAAFRDRRRHRPKNPERGQQDGRERKACDRGLAELRVVGVEYFGTLGIPLVAGRSFDRRDTDGAPPSIVINESLARAYFGSETPIGKRLTLDRGSPLNAEVIGVVGDVRELALSIPPGPGIYAPKKRNSRGSATRHATSSSVPDLMPRLLRRQLAPSFVPSSPTSRGRQSCPWARSWGERSPAPASMQVDWLPASGFGATVPFHRTDAPESTTRDALHEILGIGLDVEPQLLGGILLEPLTANGDGEGRAKRTQEAHAA